MEPCMLVFEFPREQPLTQSFVLRMFIEECTWNPHLQKGCGGSRVRQREKLSCNAASRWNDLAQITSPLCSAFIS